MGNLWENPDSYLVRLHRNLQELTSCSVHSAWSRLKPEVESRLGKDYICVPHLTGGQEYDVTSIFVKTEQYGGVGRRTRTYKSLGKLEKFADKNKTSRSWLDIMSQIPEPLQIESPKHFKLKLYDNEHRRNISIIARDLYKRQIPEVFSPVGHVTFMKNEDLSQVKKIYMVNKIILADTLELRINVEDEARILHYGSLRPFMFAYEKFVLGKGSEVLRKESTQVCSARTKWTCAEIMTSNSFMDEVRVTEG